MNQPISGVSEGPMAKIEHSSSLVRSDRYPQNADASPNDRRRQGAGTEYLVSG